MHAATVSIITSVSTLLLSLSLVEGAYATPTTAATTFQSATDGIRLQVPDEWIVEDVDNIDPNIRQVEQILGFGILANLCPRNLATPQIGGTFVCPDGADKVVIFRFADLKSRPEFAEVVLQGNNITSSDLLAFYFQFLERDFLFTNLRLLENIDTTVNVTDHQTNQTIGTVPAKYIELTYLDGSGIPIERDFALLVLADDGNTGYVLIPVVSLLSDPEELPLAQQQIFDSFELVR
jgi:hypothetical protein